MPNETELDSFSEIENSISMFSSEKRSKKTENPPKHYIVFDESDTITLDNSTVKRFGLRDNKIPSKEAYERVTKILNTRNGKILGKILYILTLDFRLRQLQSAKEKVMTALAKRDREKTKGKTKEISKETTAESDVVVSELG